MRLRLFTKRVEATTTPAQSPPSQEACLSLSLYLNITELPLKNYIEGTVNGNVSAIIKTGVCDDPEKLLAAWHDIRQQYAEVIGDQETKLFLSLYKEINRLAISIEQVKMLVQTLQKYYTKQFADGLNRVLGTSFAFDIEDRETYDKDLQRCLNRSKGYQVQMELKMAQFKAVQEKQQTPGQEASISYYQSVLITLSDHAGYRVDDSITVFEFCDRIKRLNKAMEDAKK